MVNAPFAISRRTIGMIAASVTLSVFFACAAFAAPSVPNPGHALNEVGGGTDGSVVFIKNSTGVLTEDNAKFFWDQTNFRLGLGTASPTNTLSVAGTTDVSGHSA